MTIVISENLRKQIVEKLQKLGNPSFEWDYRSEIEVSTIAKYLDKKEGYFELQDELCELNFDSIYETEISHLQYALEYFRDELEIELQDENIDFKELARELRDEFLDYIGVNFDIDKILPDVPVRVSMYSNYDCINSHWFESQDGYRFEDHYFGDIVRILKLNPAKVKKMLVSKGVRVSGQWPNKSDKKALVTYDQFWTEIENQSCGACLLTFLTTIPAKDLLQGVKTLTIPKGKNCGLFSSFQGGGSLLEMQLQTDFKIDIGKAYDKSGYLKFGVEIDDPSDSYSIQSVFGTDKSIF